MTTLDISRLQFALTITFHIIFPALSIGLAAYIVLLEGLWLKTRQKVYYQSARFYTRLLALTFGMGVVSGLAMAFQMGTNWSGFSKMVGPVLGILFTLESLTAFFVEATFLGIMVFGWHRVGEKSHLASTIMVCLATTLSAFWIMTANSWMHTPSGVDFLPEVIRVRSWFSVVFNPSSISRFTHMLLACYLATLMFIAMTAACQIRKRQYRSFSYTNLKLSLALLAVISTMQVGVGDWVGLMVHKHQPVKTAAIEGIWNTTKGAPLILTALVSNDQQTNRFVISVPKLASLINTHHIDGELKGVKDFDKSDRPNIAVVFYSFRIMVGCGLLILIVSWYGVSLGWRKKLISSLRFQKLIRWLFPTGFIALIAGWITSEVGRQPWVIYGIVKTSSVVSLVSHNQVVRGFVLLVVVYGMVFGVGYIGFMQHLIRKGPQIKPRKKIIPGRLL
jgi:cytochrome bd ubiquinol oxidase subunit I